MRLQDGSLLAAHDSNYIQFVFDVMLNSDLNRNSALIACNRGLESVVRDGAGINPEAQENILKFDEIDARKEVNRLASMLRTEGPWNYFITMTCNDSRTFGVAPIHQAIKRLANRRENESDILLQNYSTLLTRCWERTVHYTCKYMTTSIEQPLSPVKTSWMRYEFQSSGALGNRPHVHGGITLHDEPIERTLSRVRCSNSTMWSEECSTDLNALLNDGIVDNSIEYSRLMDLAACIQQHDCSIANQRCLKRKDRDDTFVCRVPRHPPAYVYTYEEHRPFYDENTLQRLRYLDLVHQCVNSDEWIMHDAFNAGMWHYPANADEHFVPTVPRLFTILQPSTNVQVCDRKFQVSYLAKYAAGQDKSKRIALSRSDRPDEIHVQSHGPINIKISGQRLHPLNNRSSTLAREIALTEMIWYYFHFPYVVSNCDFVHASTKPPEYRAAVVKRTRRNIAQQSQDGGGGVPQVVADRMQLTVWLQFNGGQIATIVAHEMSNFYLDKTTSFSLRPPELTIVSKLELYLRWFTWDHDRAERRFTDVPLD